MRVPSAIGSIIPSVDAFGQRLRSPQVPFGRKTPRSGDRRGVARPGSGRLGECHAMESDMKRLVVRAVCAALIAFATMPASAKKPGGGHPVQKIVKLKLGPFKIDAKRDREVCQAIKVPNVAGMEVDHWEARSRLSNKGLTGSHHLVLYGYDGTDSTKFPKELAGAPGCSGFGPPDFFRRRVFLSGSGGETPRGNWSVT